MGILHTPLVGPTLTRPANTTQYAAGDLIANNVTAGLVVPITFPKNKLNGKTRGKIVGASFKKSTVTVANLAVRLHVFAAASPGPVVTGGDNAALVVTNIPGYIGSMDVDMTTGATLIAGGPAYKRFTAPASPLTYDLAGGKQLYGLLEQTNATGYTPASAETFDVVLDVEAA